MCLSKLTKKYEGDYHSTVIGWKIVFIDPFTGDINPKYFFVDSTSSLHGRIKMKFDRWIKADSSLFIKTDCISNNGYYSGFHIYKNKKDAIGEIDNRNEFLVKVEGRGLIAEGFNCHFDDKDITWVCREQRILKAPRIRNTFAQIKLFINSKIHGWD